MNLKVGLVALTLLVGGALVLQNPVIAGPKDAKKEAGARKAGANRWKMLTEKLDLTADQKTKVEAILKDTMEKMRAVRQDTALTPEQKREKSKEIQDSTQTQIRSLLTPEQQTKFDELRKQGRAKKAGKA